MKYFICFLILISLLSCETDYKGENSLSSDYRLKMEKIDSMARYYGFKSDGNIYEYHEIWDTTSLQDVKIIFKGWATDKVIAKIYREEADSLIQAASLSFQRSRMDIPKGKFVASFLDQYQDSLKYSYTFEELKEIASKYPELEAKNLKK